MSRTRVCLTAPTKPGVLWATGADRAGAPASTATGTYPRSSCIGLADANLEAFSLVGGMAAYLVSLRSLLCWVSVMSSLSRAILEANCESIDIIKVMTA